MHRNIARLLWEANRSRSRSKSAVFRALRPQVQNVVRQDCLEQIRRLDFAMNGRNSSMSTLPPLASVELQAYDPGRL
jgi:hypothetical protein